MLRRNTAALVMAAVALTSAADPPRDEVVEANGLLQQGKAEAALQAYRNLQVDDPESELLYYNIGCAQLESAAEPGAPEDSPAAIDSLNAAKTSFDKASMANDPSIRRDARYNRINSDSQLAKHLAATGDHETAVKAFEDAIYGYEDFLDQYPDHAGATKNLNHMRYLLKKMLQNPPPEQEQQEQESGEGEEDKDGNQQEQQSEDGDPQKQDQPGEPESQGEHDEQQPGDESESEEGAGENEEQQPDQDAADDGESSADSESGAEQEAGESQSNADTETDEKPAALPNKETIEAILDALQERDKEEQKNMRRVPQNPRRSGPWW